MMPTTPLLSRSWLNDDVLFHIFSFLDIPSMRSLAIATRRFYDLLGPSRLYGHFSQDDDQTLRAVGNILITAQGPYTRVPRARHLHTLDLTGNRFHMRSAVIVIPGILAEASSLRILNLLHFEALLRNGPAAAEAMCQLRFLQRMTLYAVGELSLRLLPALASTKSLEYLSLRWSFATSCWS